MSEEDWLTERFERHRPQLRAVAFGMLGSTGEADDAVQESWIRLSRSDTSAVENLAGWLTTVVARVCLVILRSRRASWAALPSRRASWPTALAAGCGARPPLRAISSVSARSSTRSSPRSATPTSTHWSRSSTPTWCSKPTPRPWDRGVGDPPGCNRGRRHVLGSRRRSAARPRGRCRRTRGGAGRTAEGRVGLLDRTGPDRRDRHVRRSRDPPRGSISRSSTIEVEEVLTTGGHPAVLDLGHGSRRSRAGRAARILRGSAPGGTADLAATARRQGYCPRRSGPDQQRRIAWTTSRHSCTRSAMRSRSSRSTARRSTTRSTCDAARAQARVAVAAHATTTCRAVILTGAGEKAFCTGIDREEAIGGYLERPATRRGAPSDRAACRRRSCSTTRATTSTRSRTTCGSP